MTAPADEAAKLFEEAQGFPLRDKTRTSLLAAAARAADAAENAAFGYRIRLDLVESAFDCGEISRGLTAFAWCLACHDRTPEVGPLSRLHWRYKWVLEWATELVEVSRAQLLGLLDDAEARFKRQGVGAGVMAKLRADMYAALGAPEESLRFHEIWKTTSRDSLSDCRACELNAEIFRLIEIGRPQEGLSKTEELIAKRMSCLEVPALTYAEVLPVLHAEGRAEQAEQYHRAGYAQLKRLADKRVSSLMGHFLHLAVTGQTGRGLRILRASLAAAAGHPAAYTRLRYLVGAGVLLERISRSQDTLKIAWPAAFGGDDQVRARPLREVLASLEAASTTLAAAFDERNGNDHVSRRVRHWAGFRQCAAALKVPENA